MSEESKPKLSRKQWRAKLRMEKKKIMRQQAAKEKDEQTDNEKKVKENSPTFQLKLKKEEEEAKLLEEEHEMKRLLLNQMWQKREQKAQELFKLKKILEAKEKQRRQEEEERIKREWEEKEKRDKEEAEKRKKEDEEKQTKQAKLLKEATSNQRKRDGPWHNPLAPPDQEKDKREVCPFYAKVAVCRFGDRCSRAHPDPGVTNTLMFPGMFNKFELEQSNRDEYDTDLWLESDDTELHQHFLDFYADVVPECRRFGRLTQVKVCCNQERHLRGNVYVQYTREEDAQNALVSLNGRWFAGRQISAQFVEVPSWKGAICGQFFYKKCIKGKSCNFLHVFRNPNNEFREADFQRAPGQESSRRTNRQRSRSRSPRRRRSRSPRSYRRRSRSPRSRRKRSRSRGRSIMERRSRSPRRQRSRSPRERRSRSQSKRRSRSRRSRSRSRRRSRDRSKSRYSERYRGRERSRSRERSRRQSRQRSRSRGRSSSSDYSPKLQWKEKSRSRSGSLSSQKPANSIAHEDTGAQGDSNCTSLDIPLPGSVQETSMDVPLPSGVPLPTDTSPPIAPNSMDTNGPDSLKDAASTPTCKSPTTKTVNGDHKKKKKHKKDSRSRSRSPSSSRSKHKHKKKHKRHHTERGDS